MQKQKVNGKSAPFQHAKVSTFGMLKTLAALGFSLGITGTVVADPPYHLRVVAYEGDPAPGGGIFTNRFKASALNNRGQLAFISEPEAAGQQGIYVADRDSITEIIRFGEAAPGGGVFGDFSTGDIALNDPGDLAFGFELEEGENVYRWSHQHGTLSALIIPNATPVPDGSGLFVGGYGYPSINNRGDIAFLGNVTNPPPTKFTFVPQRTGIFISDRFGRISTVAKPGDPAPGGGTFVSAGAMYGSLFGFLFTIFTSGVDINDGGDIAFPAEVSTAPNNFTVFVRRAATGVTEPLPPPPGVVTGMVDRVFINNHGDVAFLASQDLAGYLFGGVGAVCLTKDGTTVSIAVRKDPAPGGGNYKTFGKGLAINNRGDIAFAAETDTKDRAMYLYSGADRTVQRIVGKGTEIPGEGTIADLVHLDFTELNTALNERGQMAFTAKIFDGTTNRLALVLASPGNGNN
jgi:hypothetical protein